MPNVHLRHVENGAIKVIDTASEEFGALKRERTSDGRFPAWEQTGAHDADPEHRAAPEEAASRSGHGVPLSDVTADGIGQSSQSEAQLSKQRVAPERDDADAKAAAKPAGK